MNFDRFYILLQLVVVRNHNQQLSLQWKLMIQVCLISQFFSTILLIILTFLTTKDSKTAINNLSTAYSQFAHFLVNFAHAFSRNRYILYVPFPIHYTVYYIILNNKIWFDRRQSRFFCPISSIHCLEGVLLWCLSQFMTRLCLNASNTLRTMQTVTDRKCKIVMCR